MYSTKPRNSKWAAVNDGDDGDDNDDEDTVNKNLNDGNFFRSNNANKSSGANFSVLLNEVLHPYTCFWQNSYDYLPNDCTTIQ